VELLKAEDGTRFRMVATDGSRLAKADQALAIDNALPDMPTVIVPKKGLSEIAKFLEPGTKVLVGVKNNNFIVKKSNEIIIVRLLEGEFPQYQDIIRIPPDVYSVTLEKMAFQKTLRRMSILSSESYKGIIFSFSTDRLEVRANNPELGESKEEIKIEYSGAEIEAAFNPRFFAETLAVIDSDKVNIHLVDGERPCLVTGPENTDYLSVIMPMRI
jgi:DNA polymerase-3 subunit beta